MAIEIIIADIAPRCGRDHECGQRGSAGRL